MLVFVLENFAKKRRRWTKSGRGRAFARRQRYAGSCALSSVPERAPCPELGRPRRGVAGSGHVPAPSGAERRRSGEAKAGSWTVELTGVGGGEQRRGAKLSNCARSPTRGGEKGGRRGEGRGEEGRAGAERERAGSQRLSNPCLPLSLPPPPLAGTRQERRVSTLLRAAHRGSGACRCALQPRSSRRSARVPAGAKPPCSCSSGAGCWLRSRCSWSSSSSQTSRRSKKKSGK